MLADLASRASDLATPSRSRCGAIRPACCASRAGDGADAARRHRNRCRETHLTAFLRALAIAALVGTAPLTAFGATARSGIDPVVRLGSGFTSETVRVNRTTLHYVRGGRGPAVILPHGFPQDWSAWHRVMPRLARTFTVIAPDMRGVGRSSGAGHDIANLAQDIRDLIVALKLERAYLVGHDNGGMVAYAVARLYPDVMRGLMVVNSPIPGIAPWDRIKADAKLWHFGFHQTPGLPEKLIAGRAFIYLRDFFDRLALNRRAVTDRDVAHYVRAYGRPEQLRAGLAFYREAYPSAERRNAADRDAPALPITLVGGDHAMGMLNPAVAAALPEHGWNTINVELIRDSGHWIADEQPDAVAELIERYAGR